MITSLPFQVISILEQLSAGGYEGYIVGGAVRDILMGDEPDDWDFTTNATPEEIQKLFPGSFYDNKFGTVGVPIKSSTGSKSNTSSTGEADKYEVYEITTFRTEHGYSDSRRPDKVEWGKSLKEDLSRRDFTINGMALTIKSSTSITSNTSNTSNAGNISNSSERAIEIEAEMIDPYGGRKDLEDKLIRAVGDPNERFNEDALRMMRAIRIAAELGFMIEAKTMAAIADNRSKILDISWERIRDEFLKTIASPFPADGVLMLHQTKLLELILPELTAGIGVPQGGHHIYDVFTHCVESLRFCPSDNVLVRLATLFHDVGKPPAFVSRDGKPTFYSHEVIGAKMVKRIADRLRLPGQDKDFLWKMVRWHMFAYNPEMTDSAIRRFMRRVGKEDINNMMMLRVGDRKGGGSRETSWRLEELKKRIGGLMHDPLSLTDLAVGGHDVMEVLKIKPGPVIGKVLNVLFEEILEDPTKNNREYLLSRILQVAALDSQNDQAGPQGVKTNIISPGVSSGDK